MSASPSVECPLLDRVPLRPNKIVEVVRIPFGVLDLLSYNTLVALFLANAVMSAEKDEDFLFSKGNAK